MLRTQPHAQSSQADGGSSTGMVKNKPHSYEDLSEPDMGPRDSEVPKADKRGELDLLSTGGRQMASTADC